MDYFSKRRTLEIIANCHTNTMNNKYSNEIQDSFDQSIIYGKDAKKPKEYITENVPETMLMNTGVVSAIFNLPKDKKIAVLNFASYKNPGGMFLEGSSAQEESLCHSSNLYNILEKFKDTYYQWNIEHKNRALYKNRAIYTPNVIFENDDDIRKIDVLTCAAPNYGAASRYQNVTKEENSKVLKYRAKFIKNILEENNVEIAILGAWGTGVFKQDIKEVAELWKELFKTSSIKLIVHPIPDEKTFNIFYDVIKGGDISAKI